MRNVQSYLDLMRHALGKVPNSRHVIIDTFNDAGRAMVNAHGWSWRNRPPANLLIRAGDTTVLLPADFGELISMEISDSVEFRVIPTSVADIEHRRAVAIFDSLTIWMAFDVGASQVTRDQPANSKVAEIYPAQESDRTDVRLHYRATWIDCTAADTKRVPNIPRDWERSLVLFSRAFVQDIENQQDPYENQALFGPNGEIARLKRADASTQVDLGQPLHSVMRGRSGQGRPFSTIERDFS